MSTSVPIHRRRVAASLCATFAATLLFLAVAAEPTHAAGKGCKPYQLIGARGSGQGDGRATRGMGPEVHDLFVELRNLIGGSAVLSGYGVDFPAVAVGWDGGVNGAGALLHIGFLGKYTDSVREGQADTEAQIRRYHSLCPKARFILAGYSQGAQAVGDALQRMDEGLRKLVVAAAFFGDPYFNAGSWSVRSNADPSLYGLLGTRAEWPSSLHGAVFSYCHLHDVICNVSRRYGLPGGGAAFVRDYTYAAEGLTAHVTPAYRPSAYGGRGDTSLAALQIAVLLGAPFPASVYSGPLDIVFAIDSTGSMADEIDEVKENVSSLVGQVASINPDFRVGLVEYRDTAEEDSDYQARVDLPLSGDFGAFDTELEALEAEGGGDEAESVYSGLMAALNLDWRPGARKIVIQLGDAPAKDPEPVTGLTLRDVQLKALAVDPATISTILSGEDSEAAASFAAIAAATGGEHLALPDSDLGALVPTIVDQVRRNAAGPIAEISVPSLALAGRRTTLTAGMSRGVGGPIAGYDWDFNGDGVFDGSTVDPVATAVYPQPFAGNVVLRVRSASGQASLATAPIAVVAGPARRPGKPRRLRGVRRRGKLVLSWRVGRGPLPRWFTLYGRRGKALARIPAGQATNPKRARRKLRRTTIRGLHPRRTYRFRLSAGNAKGESRRAGPLAARPVLRKRSKRHARRGSKASAADQPSSSSP